MRSENELPAWDGRDAAELLALASVGDGRFQSRYGERNENGRVYGGQMLGQTLAAAARTVPADRPASYLQFLFVAGGLPTQPIDYQVAALQDGKRFSSRHVRGAQGDHRIVCDASVSFAKPIDGPVHQVRAPDDCGLERDPEGMPGLADIEAPEVRDVERTLGYSYRAHPAIDLRAPFVDDLLGSPLAEPRMRFFIRMRQSMGDDPALHSAAFAYLSDYWINFAACIGHVRAAARAEARLYVASLNHAIWFHRPLRADQWLLFDCVSPSGAFGRGLALARVYARSGEMVASATQECLLAPAT